MELIRIKTIRPAQSIAHFHPASAEYFSFDSGLFKLNYTPFVYSHSVADVLRHFFCSIGTYLGEKRAPSDSFVRAAAAAGCSAAEAHTCRRRRRRRRRSSESIAPVLGAARIGCSAGAPFRVAPTADT